MEFDQFLKEVAPRVGLQWKPLRKDGIEAEALSEESLNSVCRVLEQYLEEIDDHPEEEARPSQILDRDDFEVFQRS